MPASRNASGLRTPGRFYPRWVVTHQTCVLQGWVGVESPDRVALVRQHDENFIQRTEGIHAGGLLFRLFME